MEACDVVVASPALDDDLSFTQRVEDLAIEQLVAQARIEAFDEAVLPGAVGRALALRCKNIDLPQLRDDLFELAPLDDLSVNPLSLPSDIMDPQSALAAADQTTIRSLRAVDVIYELQISGSEPTRIELSPPVADGTVAFDTLDSFTGGGDDQRMSVILSGIHAHNAANWVAAEDGDGAGYDVYSFDPAGHERLIEVKTTNGAARTPFFLTRNEHDLAGERPDAWRVYRVHLLAQGPRIFTIAPPLSDALHLSTENWRASFG